MLISHASDFPRAKSPTDYRKLVEQISEKDLRGWVKWLSVPRHYLAQPEENRAMAEWVAGQLKSWGYSVSFQGQFYNVVALPRKIRAPLILIGAHFDSVAFTPGADDNASAVAAMLGVAKALAGQPMSEQIGFVSFNREEDGLLGSLDFVDNFLVPGKIPVACAHILEMVGYASSLPKSQSIPPKLPVRVPDTGDFLGVLGNRHSAKQMKEILVTAKTYFSSFPVIGLRVTLGLEKFFPVLLRSDHAPFWQRKIPSVMWTDTSEFRNRNYHTEDDRPETLDYQFLLNVTRLLLVTVARQCR
jgi:hypothetical protein